MAITLKVTPETLRNTASQFESQGNTMKSFTDQMTNIVNQISGDVWSGEAATAYKSKFSGLQDDITKLHKMVQDHSKNLIEIATEYSAAENSNQQLAGSLSADVIV
jgi:WXG100 family type VII secretion target